MKNPLLILLFGLFSVVGFAQESTTSNNNYNAFKSFGCKGCDDKYFVSTNSGLLNTPIGLRVGLLGKKGVYLGARFGKGEVYHSDTDNSTKTTLFSVTGGLILPVFIKNSFSVHTYFGGGYGQWFNNRWDSWTKNGFEIEGGVMISYKKVMLTVGGAMIDGANTYPKGDATIGLGYRF